MLKQKTYSVYIKILRLPPYMYLKWDSVLTFSLDEISRMWKCFHEQNATFKLLPKGSSDAE